mmetsp:Transcript_107168/g.290361  ORF Transcript_107168/g.290361 Transcript_107168/m.290361 type:complete len:280 (+) Transcript_107168:1281-2120(+)
MGGLLEQHLEGQRRQVEVGEAAHPPQAPKHSQKIQEGQQPRDASEDEPGGHAAKIVVPSHGLVLLLATLHILCREVGVRVERLAVGVVDGARGADALHVLADVSGAVGHAVLRAGRERPPALGPHWPGRAADVELGHGAPGSIALEAAAAGRSHVLVHRSRVRVLVVVLRALLAAQAASVGLTSWHVSAVVGAPERLLVAPGLPRAIRRRVRSQPTEDVKIEHRPPPHGQQGAVWLLLYAHDLEHVGKEPPVGSERQGQYHERAHRQLCLVLAPPIPRD